MLKCLNEFHRTVKILLRTAYGFDEADGKKVGIARLLRKRAYKAGGHEEVTILSILMFFLSLFWSGDYYFLLLGGLL